MFIQGQTCLDDPDEFVEVDDTTEAKCEIESCLKSHNGKSNCTEPTCAFSYGRIRYMKFRKLDLEN